jgi:hypothetical protein
MLPQNAKVDPRESYANRFHEAAARSPAGNLPSDKDNRALGGTSLYLIFDLTAGVVLKYGGRSKRGAT